MFETLNDRGLRISQADLVKNFLFAEAGNRLTEAQHKWTKMRGALESSDEEDIGITFLRHVLIATQGYLREPDVYEAVQRRGKGQTPAIEFLDLLEAGAADYVALLNPEHDKWNQYPATTRAAVRTLLLLRMRTLRPLMLAVTREFGVPEADKSLKMLVSTAVRYLLVGGARSGNFEQLVASTAKKVSDKQITSAKDLLAALVAGVPNDVALREAFKTATVSSAYLARYYLRCLEMAANNEPEPCFTPNDDQQVINLEHILPESPGKNWPQFSPELAEALYRRIGNLALLQASKNSNLKSEPFAVKKKLYSVSKFKLTSEVATAADWTPDTIAKRQDAMADLALKAWPLAI